MFNTQHILYMVISSVLTGVLLQLANRLKEQKNRDRFLLFLPLPRWRSITVTFGWTFLQTTVR